MSEPVQTYYVHYTATSPPGNVQHLVAGPYSESEVLDRRRDIATYSRVTDVYVNDSRERVMSYYRHHKHPEHLYTVLGTGIVSATVTSPLADMEAVVIYSDVRGSMWVCRKDEYPGGYVPLAEGTVQAREPLSIADNITVYRDESGKHWVRRTSEFNDGRFTKVGD